MREKEIQVSVCAGCLKEVKNMGNNLSAEGNLMLPTGVFCYRVHMETEHPLCSDCWRKVVDIFQKNVDLEKNAD